MNNLRNRVNLIGNLGIDPEIREINGGRKMARFSLATKETYKNSDGQKVTDTQWHNMIAWGPTAAFAEKYLKKGQEVAIEGKLNHRAYEDNQGVKKYVTDVVINEILILRNSPKQATEEKKTAV